MKNFILYTTLALLLFGCTDDSFDPTKSFFKIYDTEQSSAKFRPVDVAETEEGYIILAEKNIPGSPFMGTQVFQANTFGTFQVETSIPGNHLAPVGEFVTIGDSSFFFTMEPGSFRAQIVGMGADPSTARVTPLTGLQYPLAANKTVNNQLMLLSYNAASMQTVLSIMNTDGSGIVSARYGIGAGSDVEPLIIKHFEDPERYGLPFFCGPLGLDTYYFNGFYNYSLSLVFSDMSNTPTGVVEGTADDGGMTQVLPLGGDSFSIFGFQYNDNFLNPVQSISTTTVSQNTDYLTLPFSEFKARTPAIIRAYERNAITYSIIAAESQSRSVVLYFYDTATGELSGIHTIGHINPYTLGSIKVDEEGNILVVGTTMVSGRIERLFLNKISAAEIDDILQ